MSVMYVRDKDGNFVKVPAFVGTGDSSGNAEDVQPDLNQNDPSASDYVKNRTHWEERSQTVIEWDGSAEGRDIVSPTEELVIVKVSDAIPDLADLIGGKLYLSDGSVTTIDDSNVMGDTELYGVHIDGQVYLYGILSTDIEGLAFPSIGMYANVADVRFEKLEFESVVVNPIDEKFIPDTIARLTDIPKQKEYTVNGVAADSNGNILIAPYEYQEDDVTFVEGHYTSDDTTTVNNETVYSTDKFDISPVLLILGGTYRMRMNRVNNMTGKMTDVHTNPIALKDFDDSTYYLGNPAWAGSDIVDSENETYSLCLLLYHKNGVVTSGKLFTTETLYVEGNNVNFSIYGSILNRVQLDEKFIPDTIARKSDIVIPDLTAAPTMEDFNNLLAALRAAGYLATS